MRLRTPQVTITIHPCFGVAAARRFDTNLAQTNSETPITCLLPFEEPSPDLWVHKTRHAIILHLGCTDKQIPPRSTSQTVCRHSASTH
jgi:hypothetical protein